MSSAAAKAEARRKAILSRGSDRLSKLTSSARGEDNPVYMNNEPQTRRTGNTETFIGDETIMPTTAHAGPNPALEPQNIPVDSSSAWSQDEQREFLRALMAAPELTGGSPTSTQTGPALDFTASAADDPMAAMMSALTQLTGQMPAGLGNAGGIPPGLKQMSDTPRAKTFAAKILPLLHLLATWALLAFFALYKEPEAYSSALHVDGNDGILQRWAELAWRNTMGGFGVQPVSFFWAFVSLQLALHSIQIFTKTDPLQPHMLIALALPYLPSRLRSIVTNALTYLKMAGTLLDDLAGLVFGENKLCIYCLEHCATPRFQTITLSNQGDVSKDIKRRLPIAVLVPKPDGFRKLLYLMFDRNSTRGTPFGAVNAAGSNTP